MNNRSALRLADTLGMEAEEQSQQKAKILHFQERSLQKIISHGQVYNELEARYGGVMAQWIFDRM